MGKKRGKSKGGGSEDDWEGTSIASDNTQTSFMGAETEDGAADEFAEALDWTYESRGSTRERGWERLGSLLRNSVREVSSRVWQLVRGFNWSQATLVGKPAGGSTSSQHLQRIVPADAVAASRPVCATPLAHASTDCYALQIHMFAAPVYVDLSAGMLAERLNHHRPLSGSFEEGQRRRSNPSSHCTR